MLVCVRYFHTPVMSKDDVPYLARACGKQLDDFSWACHLIFAPMSPYESSGWLTSLELGVVATEQEVELWANELTPHDLARALEPIAGQGAGQFVAPP